MFTKSTLQIIGLIILSAIFGGYGCVGTQSSAPENRSVRFYQEGYPEVVVNTVGWIDESDSTKLYIYVDVGIKSLIKITRPDEKITASFDVETLLRDPDSNSLIINRSDKVELTDDDIRAYGSNPNVSWRTTQSIPPGEYNLIINVTDRTSSKTSTVTTKALIPDPESDNAAISGLTLSVKENNSSGAFKPVNYRNIAAHYDSLMVNFQVVVPDSLRYGLKLRSLLVRFRSDLNAAGLPFYQNLYPGSLEYQGIDFENHDVEYASEIDLQDSMEKVTTFSHTFALKNEGNQRFFIELSQNDSVKATLHKDFALRNPYYPDVKTPRALFEPLVYLMEENEFKRLNRIKSSDSLKQIVDQFWTERMSQDEANKTLNLFYSRVEQANRYFTSYKEGWKTDMGMIYILYGPPEYVDRSFDQFYWSYGFYQSPNYFDPQKVFVFKQAQPGFQFNAPHFILERRDYHYDYYQRIREAWRTGTIEQK